MGEKIEGLMGGLRGLLEGVKRDKLSRITAAHYEDGSATLTLT
jgi:hypothetical protein